MTHVQKSVGRSRETLQVLFKFDNTHLVTRYRMQGLKGGQDWAAEQYATVRSFKAANAPISTWAHNTCFLQFGVLIQKEVMISDIKRENQFLKRRYGSLYFWFVISRERSVTQF